MVLAEQVIGVMCEEYSLSRREFIGHGRWPEVVDARRACVVILFEFGLQVSHIGYAIGRDHSTVLAHLGRWDQAPSYEVRETVASVRKVLRQRGIAA
jgi:chromosomal replication initiation ATPase DnaA